MVTLQELVGQEFTVLLLGYRVRLLPTALHMAGDAPMRVVGYGDPLEARRWRLECQVIGKLKRTFAGTMVQLPSVDRGYVVDQNVSTDVIETGSGLRPGMTTATITIVGPA